MHKIVFLQKRLAGRSVEAFQAALAAACVGDPPIAGLSRYVQSHTLLKGYARGELLFDALEEFSFASPEAASAFAASQARAAIQAARHGLIDPASSATLAVEVHRIKDLPVPAGAVKNIEFVSRREGMAPPDFRRYWREVHGPLGAQIPSILRYEQNHTAAEAYAGEASSRFDGLAVTWFVSTDSMREGARAPIYATVREDEANFLPQGHLPIIITREALER